MNYEFVYDFKSNKHLSTELNQLIKRSYSRSTLDDWMLKGHNDPNYQYFGLMDEKGTLVAAVGLIKTSLFFHNQRHTAIQVGNVFFRETSNFSIEEKEMMERLLLEMIVNKFQTIVDVIYYYQNDDSEPILKDFGLELFQEHNYYLDLNNPHRKNQVVRKVNLDNHLENEELFSTIKHSYQTSRSSFDISNDAIIKMYNILKYYRRNVYKIPSLGVTGVFEIKNGVFKIIATFSQQPVNLEQIIEAVVPPGISRVEFGFTPSTPIEGMKFVPKLETEYSETNLASSHLYVKSITLNLDQDKLMFPLLSRQK